MRGESARPGKRPLRALSASEKMDAIQRVHEGESKASVARDIGVPESTLRGWCKSEHKIRGMARNSSTPDSEAHSPASSSGANVMSGSLVAGSANLSSEDEGPCLKKAKFDRQATPTPVVGTSFVNDNSIDNEANQDAKSKLDYVGLMTSMAAGMRPENSSLLLQQLGLLSGASGNLAKNLLSMTPGMTHSVSATTPVGLVENGLQYTKGNSIGNATIIASSGNNMTNAASANKRHGISAIAPSQMDSVVAKANCTRKSLPAAAEAPSTPVPASPRKTNENVQRAKGKKDNTANAGNKKIDEALWLWLTQQQHILGQKSASFNPINQHDGSWFWQWYKQYSFPLLAPTTVTPSAVTKKSPSKAKAVLDNVLCNNNNENVKRCLNMDEDDDLHQNDVPGSTAEAIEHGEKFLKWLDKCSDPSVTRLQILQFKYLLDNLKSCRKKSSSLKQSRK